MLNIAGVGDGVALFHADFNVVFGKYILEGKCESSMNSSDIRHEMPSKGVTLSSQR